MSGLFAVEEASIERDAVSVVRKVCVSMAALLRCTGLIVAFVYEILSNLIFDLPVDSYVTSHFAIL